MSSMEPYPSNRLNHISKDLQWAAQMAIQLEDRNDAPILASIKSLSAPVASSDSSHNNQKSSNSSNFVGGPSIDEMSNNLNSLIAGTSPDIPRANLRSNVSLPSFGDHFVSPRVTRGNAGSPKHLSNHQMMFNDSTLSFKSSPAYLWANAEKESFQACFKDGTPLQQQQQQEWANIASMSLTFPDEEASVASTNDPVEIINNSIKLTYQKTMPPAIRDQMMEMKDFVGKVVECYQLDLIRQISTTSK